MVIYEERIILIVGWIIMIRSSNYADIKQDVAEGFNY